MEKDLWIRDFYDILGASPVVLELGNVPAMMEAIQDTIARFGR
jgi:hypothetical protein